MKKLLYLILFFSPVSIISQYGDEPNCTSVYLIRHAEKDRTNKEERNPHLNDKGIERTFKWKSFFKNIKFDKFYSTNYHRTIETIQPISNGEDIVIYSPSNIDYNDFLKLNKGKVVLVVGHSNTIPTFANNLLGSRVYNNIEDDNNSNLYVINICDDNKPINSLYIVE